MHIYTSTVQLYSTFTPCTLATMRNRVAAYGAAVSVLFVVVLFLTGFIMLLNCQDGVTTIGRVTHIRKTTNGHVNAIDQPTVVFKDDTGDSVRFTEDCTTCPSDLEVGSTVRVSYSPGAPEGASIVPDYAPGLPREACPSSVYVTGKVALGWAFGIIAFVLLPCCCSHCFIQRCSCTQVAAAGSTASPAMSPNAPQQRRVRILPVPIHHKHLHSALNSSSTLPWPILSSRMCNYLLNSFYR